MPALRRERIEATPTSPGRRFPPGRRLDNGSAIGFSRSTRQRRHLEAADRSRRAVLHHRSDPRQRSRPQFPRSRRRQLARRHRGNIYVVYADNDSHDGSDIVLQRPPTAARPSTAPMRAQQPPRLRSRAVVPVGQRRRQHRPRLRHVLRPGHRQTGDLTEVSYTFSDDGGATWRPSARAHRSPVPRRLGQRHQPTQPRRLHPGRGARRRSSTAAYAVTHPIGFADGEPGLGEHDRARRRVEAHRLRRALRRQRHRAGGRADGRATRAATATSIRATS